MEIQIPEEEALDAESVRTNLPTPEAFKVNIKPKVTLRDLGIPFDDPWPEFSPPSEHDQYELPESLDEEGNVKEYPFPVK